MRSIKPGRGPSFMGGVASIAMALFGVIWTISAVSMGAPGFFPIFGVIFVILGIAQAVYGFKNATGKNRYSAFDITDSSEETDPMNIRFGEQPSHPDLTGDVPGGGYCPYCGAQVGPDHIFCRNCGKNIQ